MSTISPDRPITTEELLALPEDGIDRDLIRGQVRETPMTKRNRFHSQTEIQIGHLLRAWLDAQPLPRGLVVGGEAGFRLKRDPDTTLGIDVAYVGPDIAHAAPESPYFVGPPILAVEILSPSDTQERIDEKIAAYLETGVKIVWIVHTLFKTVTIYRPDALPALANEHDTLTAEPHLPGFSIPVRRIFEA